MDERPSQLDVSPQSEPAPVFQRLDCVTSFPYAPSEYLRRMLWHVVECTLFRFSPPRMFGWRRMLLRMFGAKLAPNTGMASSVHVMHPWLLEMGQWSMLGRDVVVYNLGPITIGAQTAISQGVYLCAGTHDPTQADMPLRRTPIRIGSGVWIAAQAFIGPGVTIGDNSVIGARAVAMKDVPAGVVAVGNPCRMIRAREMKPQINTDEHG